MTEEITKTENKEILYPEEIFILSPVCQPKWYSGEIDPEKIDIQSDKIRGDLILENLKKANEAGYSVVIIYSQDDNQKFIEAMGNVSQPNSKNKIIIRKQEISGYSQARREAVWEASQPFSGCKVMVMLELEKPVIEDIPDMVLPIISGKADVTITDRQIITNKGISNDPEMDDEDLKGLPRYQARSERAFNVWANEFLKVMGMMPQDFSEIDWMGNRAWRNDPEINSVFLARYRKNDKQRDNLNINPDHLSSSLFFPLVWLLGRTKLRLISVPVDYHHPKIQTELENKNPDYFKKRDNQREMLRLEMTLFVGMLMGETNSLSQD